MVQISPLLFPLPLLLLLQGCSQGGKELSVPPPPPLPSAGAAGQLSPDLEGGSERGRTSSISRKVSRRRRGTGGSPNGRRPSSSARSGSRTRRGGGRAEEEEEVRLSDAILEDSEEVDDGAVQSNLEALKKFCFFSFLDPESQEAVEEIAKASGDNRPQMIENCEKKVKELLREERAEGDVEHYHVINSALLEDAIIKNEEAFAQLNSFRLVSSRVRVIFLAMVNFSEKCEAPPSNSFVSFFKFYQSLYLNEEWIANGEWLTKAEQTAEKSFFDLDPPGERR